MRREASWAFHFNPIVENPHMVIIGNSIVSMQNGVCNHLVQCLGWVDHRFQALCSENLNATDYFPRYFYSFFDEVVRAAFHADWISDQSLAGSLCFGCLVAVNFNTGSLW